MLMTLTLSLGHTLKSRQQIVFRSVINNGFSAIKTAPVRNNLCQIRIISERNFSSSKFLSQFKFNKQSPLPRYIRGIT